MKNKAWNIYLLILFGIAGFILNSCTITPPPYEPMPLLRVDSNRIVDSKNNVIFLKGLALADPGDSTMASNWNIDYFRKAREWGAQVVRIPVHPTNWRTVPNYLTLLDLGVIWARAYRMYVIIDWHSIGNLQTLSFQDPMYATTTNETLSFWRQIASRYKDEPAVAFYEVFNEPDGTLSWGSWKNFAQQIVNEIFQYNPKAIPLVSGVNYAYNLSSVGGSPITNTGVAYSVHPYPEKTNVAYPVLEDSWNVNFGYLTNLYPIIATEFGYKSSTNFTYYPYRGTTNYGNRIVNYLAARNMSWTVWCFHPVWNPTLISNWNFDPSSTAGVFFKSVLKGYPYTGPAE
jgi:aryl-phospho-beta-D-glucosidase BglC (GH1 family)